MPWLVRPISLVVFLVLILNSGWAAWAEYESSYIIDPRSTVGKSTVKTPREFYPLPVPPYENTDFKEFQDYYRQHYSPYALLLVYQPLQVGEITLPTGYHHVKLDIIDETINKHLQKTRPEVPVRSFEAGKEHFRTPHADDGDKPKKRKQYPEIGSQEDSGRDDGAGAQVCLVVKQKGSIEVVLPVKSSSAPLKKLKKGESTVELVVEPGDPVHPQVVHLKYCVRGVCYHSVPMEPGLVQ